MNCKCEVCGRDYKYDDPPGQGYDRRVCGPYCDGRNNERNKTIDSLNSLQRHGMQDGGYLGDTMGCEEFGDYVRVDDIAEAFGLTIDGPFDEAAGTSRGFRVKL